jgi:membrane fusion protein, multidrug efflux system
MNVRAVLFSLGLFTAGAGGAYLYFTGERFVSTDNAYLKFDKVTISSEVSGTITSLSVVENARVERGAVLVVVDQAAYEAAVQKARARVQKAESYIQSQLASYRTKQSELALASSNLEFARGEYHRELNLAQKKLTSQALLDERKHALDVSSENRIIIEKELSQLLASLNGRVDASPGEYAEVKEAQADLDLAIIDLDRTKIVAPFDGFVSHLPKLGQRLEPGSPVLSLVSDSNVWIEANFKETDLVDVRVEQPVDITIDSYPDLHWQGRVESLSAATGAEFSVLPPQNATGNWIKVVQRVPIRIRLQPDDKKAILRAGMSASVEIDTHATAI